MNDKFNDAFDDGLSSGLTLQDWAKAKLERLNWEMAALLHRLRAEAPNARILVLGYPNLFWTTMGDVLAEDCGFQFVFGLREVNYLLDLQYKFSVATEATAMREGVEFIWTKDVFIGHEPCGAITPRWMDFVPPSVPGAGHARLDPGAMHPNRNGHYILSRIVSCYLYLNPSRTGADDSEAVDDCAIRGIPR
jgi:hypothetical protein